MILEKDEDYIGTHICFDIIVKDRNVLRDTGITERFLNQLVNEAKMTLLIPAQVFTFPYANEHIRFIQKLKAEGTTSPLIEEAIERYEYNLTEGSGNSGIAVLAESHTALHGFAEKENPFLSICLYSCKPFDVKRIVDFTTSYWGARRADIVVMNRFIGKPQVIERLFFNDDEV